MSSIALVGGDGAGKTTLCRMLQQSSDLPFKYLYMGINIGSSNIALPTSRLIYRLKPAMEKTRWSAPGANPAKKSRLRSALRLVNRCAEEMYRQMFSWIYQIRGYIVLYDRHFWVDFYGSEFSERLSDRLHWWFLDRLYPRPDLVIFLDAPAEILLDRKRENSETFRKAYQQKILRLGARLEHFVRIDTTRPREQTLEEVRRHIEDFLSRKSGRVKGKTAHRRNGAFDWQKP